VLVEALCGTEVSDYAAVDLFEPALQFAAENSRRLTCRTQIVSADFQHFMDRPLQTWDVIFIGFSYHHLIGDAKLTFARKLRKAVSEGGEWIFFEPVLCQRQSRADYLERWKESLEQDWDVFNATEKSAIWNHVANYDFPESRQSFEEIALKAGLHGFEHLYTDPWQFYGAFRAIA
jgi:Methyltransferase domain